MSRADWRSPEGYDHLRSLDAPGFAWEYLDRNPDFTRERRRLERGARRGSLVPAELDAFTRRWGLRFRSSGGGDLDDGAVGTRRLAKRGRSDEPAG